MDRKYIKFYLSFHKAFQGKKSNHCSKTLSDGGVSSTQLSFKPRILREFQESPKINPGKNYLKNFTYFFVLAKVMRG